MVRKLVLPWAQKRFASFMSDAKYVNQMTLQLSVNHPEAEEVAITLLKEGQVIAVPTDTVYGLACCATDSKAIDRLYDIKERNKYKPLAICLGRSGDIQKWACIQHLDENLLSALLPGPVTLLLKIKNRNIDSSLYWDDKIGIRVPNCDFIRNIVNGLKSPIALTSANMSNNPSSIKITEFKDLWNNLACVFDGGVLGNKDSFENASTIVDLSEPGLYNIVRAGVAKERTCSILEGFNLRAKISKT